MKKITVLLSLLCCASAITAQRHEILDRQLHTLQVVVNDDPLLPPIMNLGGGNHLEIGFDEFSHEYHRYIYKVEHCNADWSPSTEIFESDYMNGFNGEPIEDYEKSFNTTVLYTHYSLRIPNENISLKLSGNYKLTVYNDEGDEPVPVLTACFSLVEPGVGIGATVSTNTDIDFNKSHQQVDFSVNYGLVKVIDPHRELKTVVMQNRRWDNCVVNPKPNIQAANKIEFTHNRQLIFPAGNEYHKFEPAGDGAAQPPGSLQIHRAAPEKPDPPGRAGLAGHPPGGQTDPGWLFAAGTIKDGRLSVPNRRSSADWGQTAAELEGVRKVCRSNRWRFRASSPFPTR